MARCLIGCGSNLGDRREQLDRAVELLRSMPGVTVRSVSRFRETRPIGGPAGQPAFLNAACLVETDLEAGDVLALLMAVENTLQRDRRERWAARTVDLDLLLYDELVVETDLLTLPHPRMATRRFVLEPSAEIAADLPFPGGGCSVGDLLANISAPHPFVAVVGVPGSGAGEVAAAIADATLARLLEAPVPLPPAGTPESGWLEVAKAWTRAVAGADWRPDPHGTVADFWVDCLAPAATGLSAAARERVEQAVDAALAAAATPHVAILLRSDEEPRRELQARIERRLRCPGERGPRAPKAVITIDGRDTRRAVAEAVAAVEAML